MTNANFLIWLIAVLLVFVFGILVAAIACLLATIPSSDMDQWYFKLVLVGGGIGGLLHSINSFAAHVGSGRFRKSWILWTLLRPVVGMGMAVVTYFAIRGGLFAGVADLKTDNVYGFLAMAVLSGLFSKKASDKLTEVFETLFRTKKEEAEQEKAEASEVVEIAMLEEVLAQHKKALLAIEGITGVGIRPPGTDGRPAGAIKVRGSQTALAKVSNEIIAKTASGKETKIPVIKIVSAGAVSHAKFELGTSIANQVSSSITGTAGAVVYDLATGAPRLLTCYHAVKGPNSHVTRYPGIGEATILNAWGEPAGQLIVGLRNEEIDAALIDPQESINPVIKSIGQPGPVRYLGWDDVKARLPVQCWGHSGHRLGKVTDISVHESIKYRDIGRHLIYHLIEITSLDHHPFSSPGDSGSLVLDMDGKTIGLLVAGEEDEKRGLVIPFRYIASHLQVSITKIPEL